MCQSVLSIFLISGDLYGSSQIGSTSPLRENAAGFAVFDSRHSKLPIQSCKTSLALRATTKDAGLRLRMLQRHHHIVLIFSEPGLSLILLSDLFLSQNVTQVVFLIGRAAL